MVVFSEQAMVKRDYRNRVSIWLIFSDNNYTVRGRGSEMSL